MPSRSEARQVPVQEAEGREGFCPGKKAPLRGLREAGEAVSEAPGRLRMLEVRRMEVGGHVMDADERAAVFSAMLASEGIEHRIVFEERRKSPKDWSPRKSFPLDPVIKLEIRYGEDDWIIFCRP